MLLLPALVTYLVSLRVLNAELAVRTCFVAGVWLALAHLLNRIAAARTSWSPSCRPTRPADHQQRPGQAEGRRGLTNSLPAQTLVVPGGPTR